MSFVIWMTGLPCSGKTTIMKKLQNFVPNLAVLDGDELREWLSPKDFTKEGRDEHNRKVAHLAKLLLKHKVPVGVSLISPYIANRETARNIVNQEVKFIETFVKCSLEKCEERDTKGMYKKARNNEIKGFTGISDPYEEPTNPELIIDAEKSTIEESVQQLVNYLRTEKLLS